MTPTAPLNLAVVSIGYLVPGAVSCRVHSVFRSACNFAWGETLLTLAAERAGNGPTNLLLRSSALPDLRTLFEVGETVRGDSGALRSRRAAVHLGAARVWKSAARRCRLPALHVERNLQVAQSRLAQKRCTSATVIDRAAAPVIARLVSACRDHDLPRARPLAGRLIGWGEGLTPAGDDFLVGLLAALDRLAAGVDERRFVDGLAAAIVARADATTAIAGHYLQLAARSQWNETLDRLLDAILCERHAMRVDAAIGQALEVGATSGADTVSGVVAGLVAWLPSREASQ